MKMIAMIMLFLVEVYRNYIYESQRDESKCLCMTSLETIILAIFENEDTNVDSEGWISMSCFSALPFIFQ